jgi:hypothetical protein
VLLLDSAGEKLIIWTWSKAAVKAFFDIGSRGKGRLNVKAGLDAALLEDLQLLAPAIVQFWVRLLAQAEPRVLTAHAKAGTFVLDSAGNASIKIRLTKEFLLMALNLPEDPPDADDLVPDAPEPPPAEGPEKEPVPCDLDTAASTTPPSPGQPATSAGPGPVHPAGRD